MTILPECLQGEERDHDHVPAGIHTEGPHVEHYPVTDIVGEGGENEEHCGGSRGSGCHGLDTQKQTRKCGSIS